MKVNNVKKNETNKFVGWFTNALDILKVDQESGWPDRFGLAIKKSLAKQKNNSISALSLFTGAGGLDIGLHDVGYQSQEMIEIEKNFVDSLSENTKPGDAFQDSVPRCIDIRNYTPPANMKVDFITGGPPCQSFSSAGRRASGVMGTDDPRGMLFAEYVRVLKKLNPKGFLFENVYGITAAQKGEAWKAIQLAFEEAGYKLFFRVLDAADYGVPQHRERLFIVGLKTGSFKFPYPTHGPDSQDGRPHYSAGIAVKDALVDEEYKIVKGRYGYLLNSIPPGLNYSYYTKKLGYPNPIFAWRSKFSDFLYKADPTFPVRAIKAQGGQYTGPLSWENRYFTVNELKRLQTFPDSFKLRGGRQVAIHQIGNSIPPQIARILGLAILDQVFGVKFPFRIDYMPDDFQLTFKNQKKLKTAYYTKKAKESNERNPEKKIVHQTNIKEEIRRYIGKRFEWSSVPKEGYASIDLIKTLKDETLTISVKGRKRRKFTISIIPNADSDWHIPYKKIILISEGCEKKHITMLWKALEEHVKQNFGVADLVQLFGYYQYKSTVKMFFYYNNSDDRSFWDFMRSVIEVSGSSEINLKKPTLLEFGTDSDIVRNLKTLKELGFEVRNKNTNPQIEEGVYLVPYSFPTLTKDSVQLSKKL